MITKLLIQLLIQFHSPGQQTNEFFRLLARISKKFRLALSSGIGE
jgi:hypothetical protein